MALRYPQNLSDSNVAACFQYGLEAGIVTEEEVKNWALRIVDTLADPPCEIVEVLSSRTFAQLHGNLGQVAGERHTELVGRVLLCNLGQLLPDDPAELGTIVRKAMQIVRSTGLGDDDYYLFDAVDDGLNLALSGTYGTIADCRQALVDAFEQYRQCNGSET